MTGNSPYVVEQSVPVPVLLRLIEQVVADQARSALAPRIIGAHPKAAVAARDEIAGSGIAKCKPECVFGPTDPPDDADQGLIRTEFQRDGCVAAAAIMKASRFRGVRVAAGCDHLIAPGLRQQSPDGFSGIRQFGGV